MHVETQMDRLKGLRTHRVTGNITLDDFRHLLEAVYNSAHFDPAMHSLWDMREADFSDVTTKDIKAFASFVRENWVDNRQNKAAIVVAGLADFGLTRMYEQVLGPNAAGKVRIFRNLKSAWDWIENKPNSASPLPSLLRAEERQRQTAES